MDVGIVLIAAFILLCCLCGLVCQICTAKLLARNWVAADEERRAEEERLREQVKVQKKGVPAFALTNFPVMTAADAWRDATPPASTGRCSSQLQAEGGIVDVEEASLRGLNDGHIQKESISECVVCLSECKPEEIVKKLPPCGHWFHPDCIDKWLATHSTCPVCRLDIQKAMCLNDTEEATKDETASGNIDSISLHETATVQVGQVCVDIEPAASTPV